MPFLLRVLTPSATPEEVAAVTAVLGALVCEEGRTPARSPGRTRSEWASPRRALDLAPRPGPGAWRASGLPR